MRIRMHPGGYLASAANLLEGDVGQKPVHLGDHRSRVDPVSVRAELTSARTIAMNGRTRTQSE